MAGAGALASTAALYLAAGGVGAIRLVDESRVTLADLSHPLLFRERDLGKARAAVAGCRLKEINPFVLVEGQSKSLSSHNLHNLAGDCHLIVDALDNAGKGALLSQAVSRFSLPLVHARVWNMSGCLTTLWPGKGPCLTCAFSEPPPAGPSALLGAMPGIVGVLQASEALRILAGLQPNWLGRILTVQGGSFTFADKKIRPSPGCPHCRPRARRAVDRGH